MIGLKREEKIITISMQIVELPYSTKVSRCIIILLTLKVSPIAVEP